MHNAIYTYDKIIYIYDQQNTILIEQITQSHKLMILSTIVSHNYLVLLQCTVKELFVFVKISRAIIKCDLIAVTSPSTLDARVLLHCIQLHSLQRR